MVERSCRMIRICKVCEEQQQKYCCFRKYRAKGGAIPCESCISSPFCKQIETNDFKKVPQFYEIIQNLPPVTCLSLPFDCPYIPKIDIGPRITPKQVKILKKCGLTWIAVSIQELLQWSIYPEKRVLELKKGYTRDLHEITGFSGKILLLTNIRDPLCELILKNPQKFLSILSILKPDAVVTPDANFYYDLPKFAIYNQFQRIFDLTQQMISLNIPLIGLIPPRLDCIDPALNAFRRLGIEIVGMPLLEISKYRNQRRDYRRYLRRLNNTLDEHPLRRFLKVLAISVSPLNPEVYNNYVSKSWTIIPGLKRKARTTGEFIQKRKSKLKKLIKTASIKSSIAGTCLHNKKLDRYLKIEVKFQTNLDNVYRIEVQNQLMKKQNNSTVM